MGDNNNQVQTQYQVSQCWQRPTMFFRPALTTMAMMSTSPYSVWNLNMNLAVESCITDSLMYSIPMFSGSSYSPLMPGFGIGSGELKFPSVADFLKNCNFKFNFGGIPGVNTGNNGNNSGNYTGRIADPKTPEEKEYNKYFDLFSAYLTAIDAKDKEGNYVLSDDVRDSIENLQDLRNIFSKSAKPEEKLKLFKEFKDSLSDLQIKMVIDIVEKQGTLDKIGYNYTKDSISDLNCELASNMRNAKDSIEDLRAQFTNNEDHSYSYKDVVPELSAWYSETHEPLIEHVKKEAVDKAANDENYEVANELTNKIIIDRVVSDLRRVANEVVSRYKNRSSEDMTVMQGYIDKLTEEYSKTGLAPTSENSVDLRTLDVSDLQKAFDTLYIAVRRYQAKETSVKANEKYSFLGKDSVVNNEMFVNQTEEDLKEEFGTRYADFDDVKVDDTPMKNGKVKGDTAEEKLKYLAGPSSAAIKAVKDKGGNIVEVNGKKVYETTNDTGLDYSVPKRYFVEVDGKIIELKGIVDFIPQRGTFEMEDESEKTAEELAEENKSNVVSDADGIQEYSRNMKLIANLVKHEKLIPCRERMSDGRTVFRSKSLEGSGDYGFYIIDGNNLYKVNAFWSEDTDKGFLDADDEPVELTTAIMTKVTRFSEIC